MRAVMLSVRPQWCEKICHQIGTERGKPVYEKSLEVRKNRPKIPTPFKCYIYCTVYGPVLWANGTPTNGKIIGEFVCDKMYGIYYSIYPHDPLVFEEIGTLNRPDVISETHLSEIELDNYLNGNNGYGWHISALQIYDRPKELREFTGLQKAGDWECPKKIERAPQSWCYVEAQEAEKGEAE